ncbi:MAG TPA: Stk1 family PASTA domain-containing Ser/Thr kinase [Acidimicrobiia bacterium]|nr:Stk1 family PASTA domain-containing Ser/Thr kinase [Acidimicrobiia bacterium]
MPERVYTNRYEIVRHLARGGMAEVYLAHDQLLDRRVALKVLFPEFARDPAFVQRFRREAQSAANLNHPNIVAVFDWGEEDGTYFIVMEYVEGRSLREAIQAEGPLYPNLAADLASDIAGALGFAHRNGVVHRDVKPGNILLTPQGQVKVTDFGIARAAGTSEGLTQTGSVMGTATYFSPEQAQGLPVDARSDVYSLGVVLYEMVCGVPPHTGESPISVAYKHVREEPTRPTVVNPDVPVALENIILTAMAKSPEARYASADDMRADLARFRRGEQTSSVPMAAVPVSGADVTVVNPRMDKVYDRTTVGTVVPSQTVPTAPRRSAAPFVLALVALLAVLAGLGYLLAKQLSDGGGDGDLVTVGNYVGRTEEVAVSLIEDDGLVAEVTTTENDEVEAGEVFLQDPPEGNKLEEGGTVKLTVSAGKGEVRVPDVVGETLDDAQSRLRDAGFDYRVVSETSDSVDAGKVTRTDPAGGTSAAKGSEIKLYVSTGKEQVEIPDVSGQDPVEAANALGARDLVAKRVNQPSDTVEKDTVIGTDPPAGRQVAKGSEVQLIVSSGQEEVRVPNVVGLSRADATAELQNAGFQVVVREVTSLDPANAGRVIAQSPSADSRAAKGSMVTISVGKFAGSNTTTSSSTTTTTSSFP